MIQSVGISQRLLELFFLGIEGVKFMENSRGGVTCRSGKTLLILGFEGLNVVCGESAPKGSEVCEELRYGDLGTSRASNAKDTYTKGELCVHSAVLGSGSVEVPQQGEVV